MRTLGLAFLLTLVVASPAAASFPDDSAILFSSPGDFVAKGLPHLYTDQNATMTVTGSDAAVNVHVVGSDPFGLHSFNMTFAARQGGTLRTGTYKDVVRAPAQDPKRPRMDITGDGACNVVTGNFTVKEIALDASGTLQRVQILFEQHCEGAAAALFGEIRFGEAPVAAAAVTPSELTWPTTVFGQPTVGAGVSLLVARSMSITGVSISGPDAADFTIAPVACSGSCPNPNGPFGFGDFAGRGIEYTPQRVGKSSAMLQILDSNGDSYEVPLRGSTTR